MAKASKPSIGLKTLLTYYKEVFRIPENLDHYSHEDYKVAERRFVKHALDDRIVRNRRTMSNKVILR